jgi:hypothetical protein
MELRGVDEQKAKEIANAIDGLDENNSIEQQPQQGA